MLARVSWNWNEISDLWKDMRLKMNIMFLEKSVRFFKIWVLLSIVHDRIQNSLGLKTWKILISGRVRVLRKAPNPPGFRVSRVLTLKIAIFQAFLQKWMIGSRIFRVRVYSGLKNCSKPVGFSGSGKPDHALIFNECLLFKLLFELHPTKNHLCCVFEHVFNTFKILLRKYPSRTRWNWQW